MAKGHKRDASGNVIHDTNTSPTTTTAEENPNPRKYKCDFAGCDKSYTRAEHLGRHQLNHNPKDIYRCDFPGCTRTFVRADLKQRHLDRHYASKTRAASGAVTSDEEEADSATRRVGRPRLSSLNKSSLQASSNNKHRNSLDTTNGSRHTLNENESAIMSPVARTRSSPTLVRADSFSNDPQHSGRSMTHSYSTGHVNGKNAMSIDMFNPNSTSLPSIHDYNRDARASDFNLPPLPEFDESPASVRDEFTAWLFDEHFTNPANAPVYGTQMPGFGVLNNDFMALGGGSMFPDYSGDLFSPNFGLDPTATSTSDMEILASGDMGWISSAKRTRLIELMKSRFIDSENGDISALRSSVLTDDIDNDEHVLSLRSMQLYLGSYWKHFHRQIPILHQPTFTADAADDLLVLAVMIVGASQLGARHGKLFGDAASQVATFIAWHLRWQIFMHADFRPPAKLWVFQTLILLSFYEKQCSSRQMHERAHVHSATMINLMRRGMTLIGEEETRRTPASTTPDEVWHRWIETESTRRAAFAAFVIDAVQSAMFGHSAIMVVHELRLPLPCDDALWSATSAAEVGRVHASLHTHGIKPTVFLDGLRRTLTGKRVKTNSFGRTIMIAGLVSIVHNLYQRDLQVSSLGAGSSLGMPGVWRDALAKSFDFWKRDLDDSISHMKNATLTWSQSTLIEERDAIITADILHHFSHMVLHADIIDVQVFAGAQKLFGRTISRADHDRSKLKMIDWARTAAARSAVFHSIQILRPLTMAATCPQDFYDARYDYIIYRPWSIYHAALILWAYGYALDGPLRPFPNHLPTNQVSSSPDFAWAGQTPTSDPLFQPRLEDAHSYFDVFVNVKSPDDLRLLQTGRNRLVGLLGLFAGSLRESRWQLLLEGAARFEKAIEILRDGN